MLRASLAVLVLVLSACTAVHPFEMPDADAGDHDAGAVDAGALDAGDAGPCRVRTYAPDCDGDSYPGLEASNGCSPPDGSSCEWVPLTEASQRDCNDSDGRINPAAAETPGNTIDEDCDDEIQCFLDRDGDGAPRAETVVSEDRDCDDADESYETGAIDCDDEDSRRYPGNTELAGDGVDANCDLMELCYTDTDDDGFRTDVTVATTMIDCITGGYALVSQQDGDCNDDNVDIHPGRAETPGNGVDDDCVDGEICYVDADDDGARIESPVVSTDGDCDDAGEALGTDAIDCLDTAPGVRPGATEIAGDGVDQDCDTNELCYTDGDGDSFRASATVSSADLTCTTSGLASAAAPGGDCNDANPAVSPGDAEIIDNGIDDNCNGAHGCYIDADSDGYSTDMLPGTRDDSVDSDCMDSGEGRLSEPRTDCNDADSTISPGIADEVGNGRDDDCDGIERCYIDADNDGFRLTTSIVSGDHDCSDSGEALATESTGDCCDSDANVRPTQSMYFGMPTLCGGYDYNCNGGTQMELPATVGSCSGTSALQCASFTMGWAVSAPACGGTASFVIGCDFNLDDGPPGFCDPMTMDRQQRCR